jgi:glycosyltransferase involved in cell wall biosynthesis
LKLLLISSTVYALPPAGYSGLEMLVWQLAEGLAARGHQVAVVCPEGSRFTQDNIEPIFTGVREEEEAAYVRYKARMEGGEWEIVLDSSWQRWSQMSNIGRDPQLPIVMWHHSDPSIYQSSPPVPYPMWVGLSKDHAERLSRHLRVPVKYVYNGIDLNFYQATGAPRNSRYLWVARYTPEKGAAEIIGLAQKLKAKVDLYGDTEIIGDPGYRNLCFQRGDGFYARVMPGISRDQVVQELSTHKGYLFWANWAEPFGLGPVEAMAAGCVPIVNRRGALPELMRNGVTGFIVDTLEEMEDLIRRDAVKEIKPEAMRRHVEKKFSLERFVSSWEDLLLRVVAGERW